MPRISDAVWNHFEKSSERKKTETQQQHFVATCKYCNTLLSGQPQRMKNHLSNYCSSVPLDVKQQYLNLEKTQKISDNNDNNNNSNTNDDSINNNEKKIEIDTTIARAFYASGIPLATVENPFFIQALKQINPEYCLPSRKKLSTNLLEKEYKKVSEDVKKLIKNAKYICITSDGWTNIHQESIINFMITTPKPIFWKALETKENSHTGEYIAQQFNDVIEEIGISKIAAIITDNASNMKKAHTILQKKYSDIIFLGNNFNLILFFNKIILTFFFLSILGCFAHNINLLIKSIIEIDLIIKETIATVQEIIKFFKRHHIESACLTRLQKEKIGKTIKFNLPVITRWGSHHTCLQSFLASKKALQVNKIKLYI